MCCRFVFKRVFVADGNFKADHVRQMKPSNDVWLSEGAGMIPKRQEYFAFLKTAMERSTVSSFLLADAASDADADCLCRSPFRKHLAKIHSGQSLTP